MMNSLLRRRYIGAIVLAWVLAGAAHAADLVQVKEPWAKATVPGQKVGGVYMKIVARENLRLTGVKSAVAETAQVHQMKMENGMMRMRAVPSLELPAGKTVKLKPGGYHIMLFDLRQSLVAGQKLKLELTVEDAAKRQHRIAVDAVVRDRDGGPAGRHDHH